MCLFICVCTSVHMLRYKTGDNESANPQRNCACAIPLIDGLGYQYAFIPLEACGESGAG